VNNTLNVRFTVWLGILTIGQYVTNYASPNQALKYRANLLYRGCDGSGSWGVGRCLSESEPALVALVGFAGKLLLTGGERAILVEQQAESAEEKPLDWQNGCEKWELIQTQF